MRSPTFSTRPKADLLAIALAWAFAFVLTSVALGEEADNAGEVVFKRVAPSTVFIHYEDSWGSGFVLSADGLILTNRHVIAGGLQMKVKATVVRREKSQREELDGKVVGIHPSWDMALVQVDLKDGKLVPATLDLNPVKPETRCFAVGSPDFNDQAMENTITSGKVADIGVRRPGDLAVYIKTDVPVNPGNSGGPLCGADGRVLGIITLKGLSGERQGYAIPIDKYNRKDLLEPKAPPPHAAFTGRKTLRDIDSWEIAEVSGGGDPTHEQRIAVASQGLRRDEDRWGCMSCALICARSSFALGRAAEAAYYARWAWSFGDRSLVEIADIRKKLSPQQLEWLDQKEEGFSFEELAQFAAGKLVAEPVKHVEPAQPVGADKAAAMEKLRAVKSAKSAPPPSAPPVPPAPATPTNSTVTAPGGWSKKLIVPSGGEVKIEDAPDGVVWDAAASSVRWSVPAHMHGSFKILISIEATGKATKYVTITLNVE